MQRQIEFASHTGNLSLVRNFVRQFLAAVTMLDEQKDLMVLGIDESCTNIMRHAYDHQEDHPITLVCERIKDGVRFRLRDVGKRVATSEICGRPLENIKPGGLGVHLIQRAFDHVDYKRCKDGTELVLTKHLAEA